jgi:DNA-binding NtrC family response regulator
MSIEENLPTLLPGISAGIKQSRREITAACRTRCPVVIVGEPGTGRDHVARIIHRFTDADDGPFLKLDFDRGEVPRDFDFRDYQKARATIYLDGQGREGAAKMSSLEKLTGILPDDSRLIFSLTTTPAEKAGTLSRLPRLGKKERRVFLPPLRDRLEDIPLLLGHFCRSHQFSGLRLKAEDLDYLYSHSWPRNLAELGEWAEKKMAAIPLHTTSLGKMLDGEIDAWVGVMMEHSSRNTGLLKKMTARVEKSVIRAVLDRTNGNQVESARILGVNRNTLAQKIKDLGLTMFTRKKRSRRKSPEDHQ